MILSVHGNCFEFCKRSYETLFSSLEGEKESLKAELARSAAQCDEVLKVANLRQDEIDVIKREQSGLREELHQARASRNEYLIKAEQIEAKELSIQVRFSLKF